MLAQAPLARMQAAQEDSRAAGAALAGQRKAVLQAAPAHVAGRRLGARHEVRRRAARQAHVVDDDRPEDVRSPSCCVHGGRRKPATYKHTVPLQYDKGTCGKVRRGAASAPHPQAGARRRDLARQPPSPKRSLPPRGPPPCAALSPCKPPGRAGMAAAAAPARRGSHALRAPAPVPLDPLGTRQPLGRRAPGAS